MVVLTRSAAIPLAVVVFGFVALTEPSSFVRSALLALGVGAAGLALLAATSWWQASRNSRPEVPASDARRVAVATADAADKARMDSDAG
jgi:protein-S-isoprenylcysteine O-methyltransferase Ste14